MPQRAYGVLWAVFGLAAVASLLLIGVDVWLAAGRGPRWKRALLGAGLALAASLGFVGCRSTPPTCCATGPARAESRIGIPDLEARADVVEREAHAGSLKPPTLDRVLEEIGGCIDGFEEQNAPAPLDEIGKAKVAALRRRILALRESFLDLPTPDPSPGVTKPSCLPGNEQAALESASKPAVPGSSQGAGKRLWDTSEWRRFEEVRKEASEVASSARGLYPFDEAGKKRLLDEIQELPRDILVLMDRGLLSEAEAYLLIEELQELGTHVGRFRTTDQKEATCYVGVPFQPAPPTVARLKPRLSLIEQLAADQILSGEVLNRILEGFSARLAKLDREYLDAPEGKESAEAEALTDRVKALLEDFKTR